MSTGRAVRQDLFREEESFVQTLCHLIDTPRSLAVSMLLGAGQYGDLLSLKVNPSLYQTASDFADDYLVSEVLKKSSNLPTGIDTQGVATASFYVAEKQCWETNHRLLIEDHPSWWPRFRHEVSRILGSLGHHDLETLPSYFRHGPGATTSVQGFGSVPSNKYSAEMHTTHGLMPFLRAIQGELWWETTPAPKMVVPGNRFTTVPKNAKTDRGICVEPGLNVFVQLGIGRLIREKLRRSGVDLNHQAEKNRHLAMVAYEGNLATIDLSMASDTMSDVLVKQVVPPRWSHLLSLARSPRTYIGGEWVELEKHSSMGNGYTFELETTLFLALCRAIVPVDEHQLVAVFGDDIIVPQAYAPIVIEALNYCGFKVNGEKSFLAGNFFESCGRDFFQGVDVRPFYLRKAGDDSQIPYSVQMANQLRLYAAKRGGGGCDSRFRDVWDDLYRSSPKSWRSCRVPPSFGDAGFISSSEEVISPEKTGGSTGWLEGKNHFFMVSRASAKAGTPEFYRLVALARAGNGVALFSKGFEPIRGYLRRPKRNRARSVWPKGLYWE